MKQSVTDRPNLIYVFADQLRYDALGCNGSKYGITPKLDEIAEECICLDNAVSGHPVCAPYRASLFTGKYTTSTGMVINEIRINPNHRCIAHVLNDAGYETAYIGKWHLYAAQLGHHYDTKNSFVPKGPDRLGFDNLFAAYNFHHEYYAPKAYYHLDTPDKIYAEGYEPEFMTDYAIREIDRLAGIGQSENVGVPDVQTKTGDSERFDLANRKPFALFLSLGTPHDPWTAENVPAENLAKFENICFGLPENYLPHNDKHADMWARLSKKERRELTEWMRVYYAMANELDGNIGRLYQHLKESGILDNTIFVFTSDHGEMFGAHGRRAKNIFFDEAVRVPFLISIPDSIKQGRRSDICFSTVDIMPTLLSMMGLEIPDEVEGRDKSGELLQEFVSGNSESGSSEPKEGCYDNCYTDGCLLMGTGPTAMYGNGFEWRGWRTKQYTYAVYKKDGEEHLYDNIADPLQMNNLADKLEYATIRLHLRRAMLAEMERVGDKFETCHAYRRKWVKHRRINISSLNKTRT